MGRMSRTKGVAWEKAVAVDLRQVFPEARRGIGQARSAGEVSDVEGTPFWVECKRGKQVSVRAALAQARAATDGRPIVVVVREDIAKGARLKKAEDGPDSRAVAVMPWDAYLKLLAAAYAPGLASVETTADEPSMPE